MSRTPAVQLTAFSKEEAAVIRQSLRKWYKNFARELPWRRTHDPYAILVSEFMLQQTRVSAAVNYYLRWMKRFPTVFELARTPEQTVLRYWQGLGYYARAKNLLKTAQLIVNKYRGRFPTSPRELEQLPGIGPYTAGAIAAFAYDLPCVVLDANIIRVLARLSNYTEPIRTTAAQQHLHAVARSLLPTRDGRLHNSALMELGATICIPRAPRCLLCPIKKHCRAINPAQIPLKRQKRALIPRTQHALFISSNGHILLQQSPGPYWKELWTLPIVDTPPHNARIVASEKFTVTHYNYKLFVYDGEAEAFSVEQTNWVPFERLSDTPLPSPYRRVINRLLSKELNLQ